MLQLIFLFLFSLLIMAKMRHKALRYSAVFLLPAFLLAEAVSYAMTEGPVNYQFYNHLQWETIRIALTSFTLLSILGGAVFIAAAGLFAKLSRARRIKAYVANRRRFASTIIVLSIFMLLPGGIFHNIYNLADGALAATEKRPLNEALADLGVTAAYFHREEVQAAPGKNIIVLSLESFERQILDQGNMAPNLTKLAKGGHWRYLPNLKPSAGAPATVASLYAWQTGAPLYFGLQASGLFERAEKTRLVGLGDVLKKANYQTVYLLGEPDFAGTRKFLELYGYTVKGDYGDFPYPIQKAGSFGPYDADLLNLAKIEFLKLKADGPPFMLAISTVDTHLPGSRFKPALGRRLGIDKRPDQAAAIKVADYAINEFLEFVRANDGADETVIFIMPDHLIPKTVEARKLGLNVNDRGLFLLTNAKGDLLPPLSQEFTQYELPAIFLKATGIKTNALFLADMINQPLNDQFMEKHEKDFIRFNQAMWNFDQNNEKTDPD